jgi:carbamoyltransferase
MNVLGIADNHDAGAALVVDGQLVAAVNQERLDRVKNSGAFPWSAIDAVLEAGGIRARDVDRIVVGTGFTPSSILRAFPEKHHEAKTSNGQFSPLLHAYILYQSALRNSGLYTIEIDASKAILEKRLAERPFGDIDLEMMDHHRAHAFGAYCTQHRENCLVLTLDAMGDGTTASVSRGVNGQLDRLWRQSGTAAISTFYSRITELLGFTPNRHEGKITGLAAYAPPPPKLVEHFATRIRFERGRFARMPRRRPEGPDAPFWAEVHKYSKEEVAAAAQKVLEDATVSFVSHWVEKTGMSDLALSGGTFANVKVNQRIAELSSVNSVWVMPHMGDGGLAVGAAMGTSGAPPSALNDVYLGPLFTDFDVYRAMGNAELPRYRGEDVGGVIEAVAQALASGDVIARCSGRMEWGPRALGNRSILALPADKTLNQTLNDRLKRTEFMPFAPMVRMEDVERWFIGVEKAPEAARFMTVSFPTTPDFQQRCPAATHIDGTARPQILDREDNPEVHDLLTRVGELTGTPVLINTSFNMHEEPIVSTPHDAIRAWKMSSLDGLWLGSCFIRQEK